MLVLSFVNDRDEAPLNKVKEQDRTRLLIVMASDERISSFTGVGRVKEYSISHH